MGSDVYASLSDFCSDAVSIVVENVFVSLVLVKVVLCNVSESLLYVS